MFNFMHSILSPLPLMLIPPYYTAMYVVFKIIINITHVSK